MPADKPADAQGAARTYAMSMSAAWRVVAVALLIFGAAALWLPRADVDARAYLLLHSAMETFSIVVCCLVFGAAWNARPATAQRTAIAAAFVGAAILAFFHLHSYVGMPLPLGGDTPNPALRFWQAARMQVALGLLCAAFFPGAVILNARQRRIVLAATLATVALLPLAEWLWPALLPEMFDPDTGLTPTKIAGELIVIAMFAAAAALTLARRDHAVARPELFAACAVAAIGELFFTMYLTLFDVFALTGHAFQVVAYYLVYRSLFVAPIAAPFARIQTLEGKTQETDARWLHALEAAGLGVADWDVPGDRMFRSQRYCDMLGYSRAEMGAMAPGLDALVHADDLPRVRAAMQRLRAGEREQAVNELRVRGKDGRYRWFSARGAVVAWLPDGSAARVIGTLADITEHKALEHKLTQLTRDLRALMAREQRQVEAERKRIAQALHDDLGQHLVALRMETARLADQHDKPDEQRETVARLDQSINGARDAVRRAIADLRPAALDELGLVAAVRRLAEQWGHRHRQTVEVVTSGTWEDVPEQHQHALYRIVVEALNNAAMHAHSSAVHVALMRGADAVHLTVADDGRGLDPDALRKPGHFGLFGISERVTHLGGTMNVQGAPGLGTELSVSLPLTCPRVTAR
jgi:PAS domain S-box-containing protein